MAEAEAPGAGLRSSPDDWIVRLARCLRGEGVPCAVTESVTARHAISHLDLHDPLDAYFGLRSVFLSGRDHDRVFDDCFWRLWGVRAEAGPGRTGEGSRGRPRDNVPASDASQATGAPGARPGDDGERGRSTADDPDAGDEVSASGRKSSLLTSMRRGELGAGARRDAEVGGEDGSEDGSEDAGRRAAYSPHESLTTRSFDALTDREMRDLDRAFERLTLRLPEQRSRRYRPSRRRGRIHVRRSFRHALRHEGELIRLARQRRRREPPRVVLLCDVSGSMERFSRFLVRFVLVAARERRVETFVFGTRLTRLTPWLSALPLDEALDALTERVPDWSGGTRIGESLETFVETYGRRLLDRKTVVVIMSDGLDRGDTDALERAMGRIHRSVRKVLWLNPLMGSPRYAPEARGMKAALPHVDELAPGHSVEALREAVRMIRL